MLNFNSKLPTDIKIGNKTVETVWMRNEVVWSRVQEYFYIENTYNGSNRVDILVSLNNPTGSHMTELQYSTDKLNWTTYQLSNGSTSITLSERQRMYFRNDNGYCNTYVSDSNYWVMTFNTSESYIVGGNINSLLDYTDMYNVTLPNYCYYKLFNGSSTLTSATDLTLVSSTASECCYRSMFFHCTSLVTPPSLSATTLADYCCFSMFNGCTSLTTAPSLPATTTAYSCYENMFANCTALTTVPALPATALVSRCYYSMFNGCTSLTTAPSLPATTLADYCCYAMFANCTSLTTAPSLPATTLVNSCYEFMFYKCTSLTTVPALPATTLVSRCYYSMFNGCTSLTTAPSLPATTLTQNCYQYMFRGCTSLNKVTTYANNISASDCINNWLQDVAPTGTFHNYGIATYTIDSASGIPQGWTEVKHKNYFYVENENNGQNTIKVTVTGTPVAGQTATSIDYSTDKTNWTTITITKNLVTDIVLSNKGDKLYFKNNSGYLNNNIVNGFRVKFYATNNYSVGGDTTTLWNSDYDVNKKMPEGCLRGLFSPEGDIITGVYNDYLIDSSRLVFKSEYLPVVSSKKRIPNGAYYSMFGKCINMVNGPSSIPADTIGESSCYWMFYWNVKLKNAPTLQATKVETLGYYGMFIYCNKLEIAPTLPATTIGDKSYRDMFWKCVTITAAPTISATTLGEESMTGMFIDCRNMTTGPELFAKTLKRACYSEMFQNCTSLNEVTIYADNISAASCLKDWLENVAATGTFHNLGSATYPTGESGIPSGWTEVKS